MRDISSHLLDIAQNSIVAGAQTVKLLINIDERANMLTMAVEDDGCGMSSDMQKNVLSPFVTSRTSRKVGFGLPLLKAGAEGAGGTFVLHSQLGVGTKVESTYQLDHIDRPPMGELSETLHSLIQMNPHLDFEIQVVFNGETFAFLTKEAREILGEVPLDNPDVSLFILSNITENIKELFGGKIL